MITDSGCSSNVLASDCNDRPARAISANALFNWYRIAESGDTSASMPVMPCWNVMMAAFSAARLLSTSADSCGSSLFAVLTVTDVSSSSVSSLGHRRGQLSLQLRAQFAQRS